MKKTILTQLLVLSFITTGCFLDREAPIRHAPVHYYEYWHVPRPSPYPRWNPYTIPPPPRRPVVKPPYSHPAPSPRPQHRPSNGINYNTRPSAPARPAPTPKPTTIQTKPLMPHNGSQRGPSPYSNQKQQR